MSLVRHAALNIIALGDLVKLGYCAYITSEYLYLINLNERKCIVVAANIGAKNTYIGPVKGRPLPSPPQPRTTPPLIPKRPARQQPLDVQH